MRVTADGRNRGRKATCGDTADHKKPKVEGDHNSRREPLERKVMKWQEWRGFVVSIFASLGLIGCAGAGGARAAVAPQLEASFDLPKEEGVAAHATVASPSAVESGLRTELLEEKH